MNHNKPIVVLLFTGAIAFYAYAKSDETQGNAKSPGGECGVAKQKDAEHYRKAAEEGNVDVQELMGWVYYDKNAPIEDKAEAMKWWCRVGHRGSEMMKAILRLAYHSDERVLIYNAADAITANGGRPLPVSNEPIAFRVECGRRAYIDKWLGFSESNCRPFPKLVPVTNTTMFKLDFAERFDKSSKDRMALFPDGEIRWCEDGTNGLSFVETTAKMNAVQIEIVRELMQGYEQRRGKGPNDKPSATWILNDDFTFGYFTIPHKGGRDEVYYVFTTRHEMNGIAPKTCALIPFAPSQLMSDSIMNFFLGDKAALSNLNALKDAGIVALVAP